MKSGGTSIPLDELALNAVLHSVPILGKVESLRADRNEEKMIPIAIYHR